MDRRNFIKTALAALAALIVRGNAISEPTRPAPIPKMDNFGINAVTAQWGIADERGVIEWHSFGDTPTLELSAPIDDRTEMEFNKLIGKTFTVTGTYYQEEE